jgi:PRC-barrel domain
MGPLHRETHYYRSPVFLSEGTRYNAAREPKVRRGAGLGSRDKKDAKPLLRIDELAPGLRTDEMIGAEVRSSDDKIVGEVRNIVFGTKDGRDYAIVASGGFFTAGPICVRSISRKRISPLGPVADIRCYQA